MKSALGWLMNVMCLAAVFLGIWAPFGSRWQWIASAVVFLVLAAWLLGTASEERERERDER